MQFEVGNGSAPTKRKKSGARWRQRAWLLPGLLVSTLEGAGGTELLDQQLCDAVRSEALTETKQLLLAPDADPNAFCERCFTVRVYWVICGATPLHIAAEKNRVDIADALLRRRAKIDNKDRVRGSTPLHLAAYANKTAMVAALLGAGAKAEEKDGDERTALHAAAIGGSLDVVKVLVANNADVLATDKEMETPAEIASSYGWSSVAKYLIAQGGAAPTSTSFGSWAHVLRFHPGRVAASAGVGVLLAAFKIAVEWKLSGRAGTATQDPSPALVGRLVPSKGALRLAAKAIAKGGRCGALIEPANLLASSFAVCATLLFACGPCMWACNPLIVVMVLGPAFLVPAVCTFGWREVVEFPALVMAAKTPSGRLYAAITTLFLFLSLHFADFFPRAVEPESVPDPLAIVNERLEDCFVKFRGEDRCNLVHHTASFSLGPFTWQRGVRNMEEMHVQLNDLVTHVMLAWVLGVAVTTSCCCRLPVASRAAVEELAREIDNASTPKELPKLHPKLRPEGLLGLVIQVGFAAVDILQDLNTIGTFVVTCNFWFATVLWTVFLASLASELVRGNVQALPKELGRSMASGVMTDRLIEFLDTDKGFEAPFSLAITMYAMPFVARTGNTFLMQCFSLLTSTVGIAGFLNDYLALAALADVTTHQLITSEEEEADEGSSESSGSCGSSGLSDSSGSEDQMP